MKRFGIAFLCAAAIVALGFTVYFRVEGQHRMSQPPGDDHSAVTNATVSFGGWMTDVPIDRFPNVQATQFPIARNHHRLTPEIAKIKAGGTVNFIIGGFHVVTVYGDGKRPEDVNTSVTQSPAGGGPPIINDPDRRIYRGLDPTILPPKAQQDRVEVVHFDEPGTYLVICSVLPHFNDGMYGYVRVLPGNSED